MLEMLGDPATMPSMGSMRLPFMWSECIPYSSHVARVSHHARYQFMVSTCSECIAIYCPCAQSVSPYIANMLGMSHNMPYQFILSMWPECHHILPLLECPTICRINSYCPCAQSVTIYCPCGQSVSRCCIDLCALHGHYVLPCIVSIDAVHMVKMSHNILPMWSGCLMICRINLCCPYGQNRSHVLPTYCPHIAHVVRVSHDMLH